MYKVVVTVEFSAAHALRSYSGPCENLHGHNWKVLVHAQTAALDDMGMVVDFHELKKLARDTVAALDHKIINEIPPFDAMNPTSENMARWVLESVAGKLNPKNVCITQVDVFETDTSMASYCVTSD